MPKYSSQVEKNSAYLLELIDNIIDIAEDSQTADMPKEAVDVNACCLECIDELGKGRRWNCNGFLSRCPGDMTVRAWMKCVCLPLLDNAGKFTERVILQCEKIRRIISYVS